MTRRKQWKVAGLIIVGAVVVIGVVAGISGSSKPTPKVVLAAHFTYSVLQDRIHAGVPKGTIDVVFSVKNTGTGPGALWCSVSLQKGSNPLSVTQPTEYPPALGAKATRTLTVGVPPGAPGTPDTAEVVCGISKTAVSNSNAFASGSTLAAVNPVAFWYKQYGSQVFPIVTTDFDQVGKDAATAKTGKLGTMESDCSQFVSDLSTELSYPASDVPPIPSAVDQSEWRSALRQMYLGAKACVVAGKDNNIGAMNTAAGEMLAGGKVYARVTATVENAWKATGS